MDSATPPGSFDPSLANRAGLTARQRECLDLRLKDFSYRQIADALSLEHSTVYGHVQRALRKLGPVMR